MLTTNPRSGHHEAQLGENQLFSTPWREVQKFLTVNIGVRSGNMCVGFGTQSEILMWNIKNLIFHPHMVRNRGDSLGFDFGQPIRVHRSPATPRADPGLEVVTSEGKGSHMH